MTRSADFVYRILVYRPDVDGRIVVSAVVVIYLLMVALGRLWLRVDIWPSLGVPSGPSLFFDTRNLTAALECRRLGFDPLVESPCDPWDRPLVYPRVWLALRWLGLDQSDTFNLGVVFVTLFFVSLLLLVGRISLGAGIVVAIAACSPGVMFAVERANMDIVIFTFLVCAVLAWRSGARWAEIVSPLVVFLAATAKIYPVFGLPAYLFLRQRRATVAALTLVAAFAIYVAITLRDLQAVTSIAPQGVEHSFGVRILPASIYHLFVPDRWIVPDVIKQLVAAIPLLVAFPLIWIHGRRRMPLEDGAGDSGTRLAFYLGSLIFLGTFAAGNNFDYRLVFLLLTLPQLLAWTTDRADPRSGLATGGLVAVVGLVWVSALSGPLNLWDEVATWVAAALLLGLLAASLPGLRTIAAKGEDRPHDRVALE